MTNPRRFHWAAAPIAVLAACLLACSGRAPAQTTPDTLARIAFTNLTLIDGTGAPSAPARTILVDRGLIEDVFETGSRALPTGVRVVDLAGKFAIPGLIDAHVHVATDPSGQDSNAAENLRLALLGGLTAVRDMAGDAIALKELAVRSRRADADSPRLFLSLIHI